MAAAGIGNSAGAVWIDDFGAPITINGNVRNERISGGVFVFGSMATNVVSSGADTFDPTTDMLFTRDASGGQFNGICLQTTAVSGEIAVAAGGIFIVQANATILAGTPVGCDGENAAFLLGSKTMAAYTQFEQIGRALTGAASGGFMVMQVTP